MAGWTGKSDNYSCSWSLGLMGSDTIAINLVVTFIVEDKQVHAMLENAFPIDDKEQQQYKHR